MQKQRAKTPKATPMRHQCDIKATSKPVGSQLIGTPEPPPCDSKATLMRPQCDPNATPRLPQSHPEAKEEGRMMKEEGPDEGNRQHLVASATPGCFILHPAFCLPKSHTGAKEEGRMMKEEGPDEAAQSLPSATFSFRAGLWRRCRGGSGHPRSGWCPRRHRQRRGRCAGPSPRR